jgi:hypothetical protein
VETNYNDRVLAMCELSNDLLFNKIKSEKYLYYIDGSLSAGASAAQLYKEQNIKDLYKSNGIEIEYSDEKNIFSGVEFRAQVTMDKNKKSVKLYRKSIDELARMSTLDNEAISLSRAIDIHLCHEFYHYLEFCDGKSTAEKLDTIVTMKIGPFERKAHINRCSEIAAHSFAKEMLQLEYMPNVYDYIYLINSKKITQKDFDELIEKYNKELDIKL